ncbi:hypothetical protein LCGC14_1825110 [marine sediment metagenome]|uniref:Uncharacterized protein n=1 Tax=marine sediment metagenome TaxID=412755 RepID=A0A0F9GHY4_9ZZZZ
MQFERWDTITYYIPRGNSMSMYGNSYSKFKSINVSPATVVSLNHSNIIPGWGIEQLIKNVSVFTVKSTYIDVEDDFAEFEVEINVWKNGSPATVMTNILQYNHDVVNFMPHQDNATYVQANDGGGDAEFYIESMTPVYFSNEPPILKDRLIIKFISIEAIDASTSIA